MLSIKNLVGAIFVNGSLFLSVMPALWTLLLCRSSPSSLNFKQQGLQAKCPVIWGRGLPTFFEQPVDRIFS